MRRFAVFSVAITQAKDEEEKEKAERKIYCSSFVGLLFLSQVNTQVNVQFVSLRLSPADLSHLTPEKRQKPRFKAAGIIIITQVLATERKASLCQVLEVFPAFFLLVVSKLFFSRGWQHPAILLLSFSAAVCLYCVNKGCCRRENLPASASFYSMRTRAKGKKETKRKVPLACLLLLELRRRKAGKGLSFFSAFLHPDYLTRVGGPCLKPPFSPLFSADPACVFMITLGAAELGSRCTFFGPLQQELIQSISFVQDPWPQPAPSFLLLSSQNCNGHLIRRSLLLFSPM